MARDFIKIDRNNNSVATEAQDFLQYINVLRDAYNRGKAILGNMAHLQDGTVFTDLEAVYGVPSGKGQTIFNFVNGSVGSMEGVFQTADVKNITEQVG